MQQQPDIEEINISNLYVYTSDNKTKSLKTFLNSLQAKYDKNPDATINMLSGGAKKKKIQKAPKNVKKIPISNASKISKTHCVSCSTATENQGSGMLIINGGNCRLQCICLTCNKQKSSFIKKSNLPQDIIDIVNNE